MARKDARGVWVPNRGEFPDQYVFKTVVGGSKLVPAFVSPAIDVQLE